MAGRGVDAMRLDSGFGWSRCSIVFLFMGLAAVSLAQDAPWPTRAWSTSSAEQQGLQPSVFAELDRAIRSGAYGYVNRMVVVRNGLLVVNQRYRHDYRTISRGHNDSMGCGEGTCDDAKDLHEFNYYHPNWHPFYRGREIHTLQSVTKSITSALIGIAIGRGEIKGVDVPILPFFEDYDLSRVHKRLYRATLADLLTMRTGIEWHVGEPFDETNSTYRLEQSADWIQFTLDEPMDAAPGEKWAYNSGSSQMMSGIIKRATQLHVDQYAEAHLFGPLGIDDYHWKKTPRGFPDTEGGLYLEAEQLAKIGYLYLQDGIWDGRRILPVGWVQSSVALQVEHVNEQGNGYGYQWWRLDRPGVEIWAGLGMGGQYLLVLPEQKLIAVINSWNIFGGHETRKILVAFLDAILDSVGTSKEKQQKNNHPPTIGGNGKLPVR